MPWSHFLKPMQVPRMSIRFVIVNCDLYFHMHIYDNDMYMHIWCMILKRELALLFSFSRFLCSLQLLLLPPCFCPVSVIQCTYVLMLIFEPYVVYFNNHIKCSYWLWLWVTKVLVACKTFKYIPQFRKSARPYHLVQAGSALYPFKNHCNYFDHDEELYQYRLAAIDWRQ